MRRVAWSALLLLGTAWSASGAGPVPLSFATSAQVEVDSGGRAHVIEMGEITKLSEVPALVPIADKVNARLRDAIESWNFIPATRDGVAVSSRTSVNVMLEGYDDGNGGLAIRIRNASTGAGLRSIDKVPLRIAVTYAQSEGFVTLKLTYDANGRVTDATIKDSMELWHGKFSGVADKQLRKSAVKAATTWLIFPEVVAGQPQAGTGTITVRFCLNDGCDQIPLPRDPTQGNDPQQFAAIDPAVKLRSAVAGTAL